MKKYIISVGVVLWLLLSLPFISFATQKIRIEKAKNIVNEYIQNSQDDEYWQDSTPYIRDNGTFYYTDSDNNPSYIEFQIWCRNNEYCWFVILNIDQWDVWIPLSGTSWVWPSQVLQKLWEEENTKLYYFWAFSQWSINTTTGDILSINPEHYTVFDNPLDAENQRGLQERFQKEKQVFSEAKKSPEFRKMIQEIKEHDQHIDPSEFAMKVLDMNAHAYTYPWVSNTFVSWAWHPYNSNCNGKTPCYDQFYQNYWSQSCWSGCSPTSVAIIYAYHDRNGKYQLFPNMNAPLTFDPNNDSYNIKSIVNTLRSQMGTYCSWTSGSTPRHQIKNAITYAQTHGYPSSESEFISNPSPYALFEWIKTEIDANRPVNVSWVAHSFVAFWYKKKWDTTMRINIGWWPLHSYTASNNGQAYNTSNIDMDIYSIQVNDQVWQIEAYTTFNIKY